MFHTAIHESNAICDLQQLFEGGLVLHNVCVKWFRDTRLRASLPLWLQGPCVIISWFMFGDVLSIPMLSGDLCWQVFIQVRCYMWCTYRVERVSCRGLLLCPNNYSKIISNKNIFIRVILVRQIHRCCYFITRSHTPKSITCPMPSSHAASLTPHCIAGVLSMCIGSLHHQQVLLLYFPAQSSLKMCTAWISISSCVILCVVIVWLHAIRETKCCCVCLVMWSPLSSLYCYAD